MLRSLEDRMLQSSELLAAVVILRLLPEVAAPRLWFVGCSRVVVNTLLCMLTGLRQRCSLCRRIRHRYRNFRGIPGIFALFTSLSCLQVVLIIAGHTYPILLLYVYLQSWLFLVPMAVQALFPSVKLIPAHTVPRRRRFLNAGRQVD